MRKIKLLAMLAALFFATGMYAVDPVVSGGCTATLNGNTITFAPTNGVSGEFAKAASGWFYPWAGSDYNNASVTKVVVESGITTLPPCFLFLMEFIESVELSEDITTIGFDAFAGCSSLTSLTIPASVTKIGAIVFDDDEDYNTSTNQNKSSFQQCNALTDIYFWPNAVDLDWEANDVYMGKDFKQDHSTIFHARNSQIEAYMGRFGNLNVNVWDGDLDVIVSGGCQASWESGTITFAPVNGVSGEFAMAESKWYYPWAYDKYGYMDPSLTKVVVESGITTLPPCFLLLMENIESIELSEGITTIGFDAFGGCTKLQSITIPASVTHIGSVVFDDDAEYNTSTNQNKSAFESCNALTDVYCYPDAADLTWNASASYMSHDFKWDGSTRFHVHPDQLAAYQAKFPDLHAVLMGDLDVLAWESGTCTITLEDGVLNVAPTDGISGVMAALEPGQAEYPWYAYREQVTSIVMHDGVTSLFGRFFNGCSNATSAHISNSAIMIGGFAFGGCSSLTSIVIPASISAINEDAFHGCTGMNDIYVYASPYTMHYYWPDENQDDFKPNKATRCHVVSSELETFEAYWGVNGEQGELNLTFVGDLGSSPEQSTIGENSTAEQINDFLAANDNAVLPELTIEREVFRNGYYNTICLPFSMTEEEIAASPLAGAEIKEFADAYVDGEDVLHLTLNVVTSMAAGVPYFIRYTIGGGTVEDLDFTNVRIDQYPKCVIHNGVTFWGTFDGFYMQAQEEDNHCYLFLGQNNQLYWPEVPGRIKPFRAYFIVEMGAIHSPLRRGMPAVFDEEKVATGVDNVQTTKVQSTKRIENGVFYIIKNGVKYNAQGQIVK